MLYETNHDEQFTKADNFFTETLSKKNVVRFGDPELTDIYLKTIDLIKQHNLTKFYTYTETDTVKQLTICNLWRIEKNREQSLTCFKYDLVSLHWRPVRSHELCSSILIRPYLPYRKITKFWPSVIKLMIIEARDSTGYLRLSETQRRCESFHYSLNCNYLGSRNKKGFKDGCLSSQTMDKAERGFIYYFYKHIYEKEIMSVALAINYRCHQLSEYAYYAQNYPGIIKISREHRNLLPLLGGINASKWMCDDLFSKTLWVKGGRKYTSLHRKEYCDVIDKKLVSFDYPQAWTWLKKASIKVVNSWYDDGHRSNALISNIALANYSGKKIPVIAYIHIIRTARLQLYPVSLSIQKTLRVFLCHIGDMWAQDGFSKTKEWLARSPESSISDMLDYLEAEGFVRGQPEKNATWETLLRASDEWHRRVVIGDIDEKEYREWDPIIGKTVIDGVTFIPLANSRELAVEGYEMHHCVRSYAVRCYAGRYRLYALVGENGVRATLGLSLSGMKVSIDQCRGVCNKNPSIKAINASRKFVKSYQQDYLTLKRSTRYHDCPKYPK